MRFVVLAAIVFIAFLFINRALGNARQAIRREHDTQRTNNNKTIGMVQCSRCGVHIPEHEAVHYQNKTWCSLEHAKEVDKL